MEYAAGIVLYNPEIGRLRENVSAISPQVGNVIIIDNGSKNTDDIAMLLADYGNIRYIRNAENCGIARALNQIIDKAEELGASWVLSLDQDTVCEPDIIERYADMAKRAKDDVAIITSKYKDRSVEVDFGISGEYEKVSFCITSGAFNNIRCIKAVGGFDEKLFIDMVDYDICYALTRGGYKIVRMNYTGFLHEVGRSVTKKFFGKPIIIFNHSPLRKYYWARNSIYLKRKYKLGLGADKRVINRMIQTLLYETDKLTKLKSMCKGVADGYKM